MSRKLINVGVRLRLGKSDPRDELRFSLKHSRALHACFYLFFWVAILFLIWLTKDSEGFRPTLLLFVASLLMIFSATGFHLLNSRINTLIELLREEGILANALAVPRETEGGQDPAGEKEEDCMD